MEGRTRKGSRKKFFLTKMMFKRYVYRELNSAQCIHELKYNMVPHKCVQYVCVN